MVAHLAGQYESVDLRGPHQLLVHLKLAYNKDWCDRPDVKRKLEQAVSRAVGRDLRIEFAVVPGAESAAAERAAPAPSRLQKMRDTEKQPLVREALQLFDGEIVDYEDLQPGGHPRHV